MAEPRRGRGVDVEELAQALGSDAPGSTERNVAHFLDKLPAEKKRATGVLLAPHGSNGGRAPAKPVQDAAEPPPDLARVWADAIGDFLDPNPFMLRLADAGLGREVDRLLGGGLTVGQTVVVGAAGAGVGKTALLHQLADGVAESSARAYVRALEGDAAPVIVPVLFVSEMTVRDLTLRSLARNAGVEGYLLRDPRGPRGCMPLVDGRTFGGDAILQAYAAAERFADAARFITPIDRRTRVAIGDLTEAVERIRARWEAEGAVVPAVLVVVDPLHRLLDPRRPEVEGIGEALLYLVDLAQRGRAIVAFTSDTNRESAGQRKHAGALQRGDELADVAEMAFRGSYQLLHLPDVALGLVTLRADDERLPEDDRTRLQAQPPGTMYAEVVNAKSRWESRGLRAGFFLDPAMFRFRPTSARDLPRETSLEERISAFVAGNPGCSENAIRKAVPGRDQAKREAVRTMLRTGRLVDDGSESTGRKLRLAETPHGTRREQGGNNPRPKAMGAGVVPGGSPHRGESLPPEQPDPAPRAAQP